MQAITSMHAAEDHTSFIAFKQALIELLEFLLEDDDTLQDMANELRKVLSQKTTSAAAREALESINKELKGIINKPFRGTRTYRALPGANSKYEVIQNYENELERIISYCRERVAAYNSLAVKIAEAQSMLKDEFQVDADVDAFMKRMQTKVTKSRVELNDVLKMHDTGATKEKQNERALRARVRNKANELDSVEDIKHFFASSHFDEPFKQQVKEALRKRQQSSNMTTALFVPPP